MTQRGAMVWGGETQEGGDIFTYSRFTLLYGKREQNNAATHIPIKQQTKKARQQGFCCFVSVVKQ